MEGLTCSPRIALFAGSRRASSSSVRRHALRVPGRQQPACAAAPQRAAASPRVTSSPTVYLEQLFSSFLSALPGGSSPQARSEAKAEMLAALRGLNRGVTANEQQQAAVEAAARKLERCNPNPRSLAASCVNGRWELIYTTSVSILGSNRPAFLRPQGPIYQTIDTKRLRAKNQETFPWFSSVTAALTPTSPSAVNVQFKTFRLLGFIAVTAPEAAKGALDTTYVDEELRVSRGDKGNLFVLRMADPDAQLPDAAFEAGVALSDAFAARSVREFR